MARPSITYMFEALKPGQSRVFTLEDHGEIALAQIVSGVRTRRRPDGRRKYSIRSRSTTTHYLWVEVYCRTDADARAEEERGRWRGWKGGARK